jgi:hypothetical protein
MVSHQGLLRDLWLLENELEWDCTSVSMPGWFMVGRDGLPTRLGYFATEGALAGCRVWDWKYMDREALSEAERTEAAAEAARLLMEDQRKEAGKNAQAANDAHEREAALASAFKAAASDGKLAHGFRVEVFGCFATYQSMGSRVWASNEHWLVFDAARLGEPGGDEEDLRPQVCRSPKITLNSIFLRFIYESPEPFRI